MGILVLNLKFEKQLLEKFNQEILSLFKIKVNCWYCKEKNDVPYLSIHINREAIKDFLKVLGDFIEDEFNDHVINDRRLNECMKEMLTIHNKVESGRVEIKNTFYNFAKQSHELKEMKTGSANMKTIDHKNDQLGAPINSNEILEEFKVEASDLRRKIDAMEQTIKNFIVPTGMPAPKSLEDFVSLMKGNTVLVPQRASDSSKEGAASLEVTSGIASSNINRVQNNN